MHNNLDMYTPELLCKNIINIGCLFQEIYSIFNQKVITETAAFKFEQSYFQNYNSLIALNRNNCRADILYMYNKLMFLDWCVINIGRFVIKFYPTPLFTYRK